MCNQNNCSSSFKCNTSVSTVKKKTVANCVLMPAYPIKNKD